MKTSSSIAAIAAFAAITALAGCASTAPTASARTDTAAASAPSCAQLDADIAQTDEALRTAKAKGQDAWKAVVPFAVAARYASGQAAANDAAQQLDALRAEAARLGCPGHAG